jgi:hypothetical protein
MASKLIPLMNASVNSYANDPSQNGLQFRTPVFLMPFSFKNSLRSRENVGAVICAVSSREFLNCSIRS